MIIQYEGNPDFIVLGPGGHYCSLHEHAPSAYTQMRITTLCYNSSREAIVVISTFSEGKWYTSAYVTDEVYKESYNKFLAFLCKES